MPPEHASLREAVNAGAAPHCDAPHEQTCLLRRRKPVLSPSNDAFSIVSSVHGTLTTRKLTGCIKPVTRTEVWSGVSETER